MQITGVITCVFIQIISENISLRHGIIFQAPEPFKMPYPKKPRDVNTPYGANPYQGIVSRQVEIREKIRGQHGFQNSLISLRRTSQMVRRSPTAFDDGYTF